MKTKKQPNYLAYAANILLVFAGMLLYEGVSSIGKRPKYHGCENSCVTFKDNDAFDLAAFVEYYDGKGVRKRIEMLRENIIKEQGTFQVPKEALEAGIFTVWAVDRDWDESKPRKLYSLDERVLEELP